VTIKDIVIIGGGLVGMCAALVLQHPRRRISVLEATNPQQAQASGLNARSIALSISSVQIFKALNIWSSIETLAAPIRHIHVSSRGHWGVTRLRARDYNLDALGYVVESQVLGRSLQQAVAASTDIELLTDAEFETIAQQQSVTIGYRKQGRKKKLESRLALIADGAHSQARAALGIDHESVDYGQSVVICNVEFDKPRSDTAYERFTDQGPLAMLPLGGSRYACMWTQDTDTAAATMLLDESDFMEALQTWFGLRLGFIERVGRRNSFPLQRTRAGCLQRQRCIVIGNAANALHPVAGQSFNLSLRDIACLYELLVGHNLSALDDDQMTAISSDYEHKRVKEHEAVIRFGDGLVNLFSNDLPIFNHARAAGLSLLDLLPPLKRQVALAGMGMTFAGNRLLRGHL